ncbi:hypothetical protein [Pelagibius marinus]|uniref:hypothetical protein n=1 Tax=Pelagibius marinus TaxID=2762760 RepID=UPI001872D451|nr:hypothetical protein [Pelagibius marinus]
MSVLEHATTGRRKLSIWQATKAAYRSTFANPGRLAIAAAVPFVLSLLLDGFFAPEASGFGLTLAYTAASTAILALFELTWLRFLLLGPAQAETGLLPGTNRRLPSFVAYSLLLLLLFMPALLLVQITQENPESASAGIVIGTIVVYVLAIYLCTRFILVYPWIAVDAPERLTASWRATAGNGLRLIFAILLAGIPLLVTAGIIIVVVVVVFHGDAQQINIAAQQGLMPWVSNAIGNLLVYIFYALSCGVTAYAFSALTGWQGDRRELLERFD